MREVAIYKALTKAKKYLEDKGYNVFAVVLQGSQNYELDVYTEEYMSDFDCKAFVLPSFDDVYTAKKVSKVYKVCDAETGLEQVEVKDLRMLPELVGKGNPSYLELLATRYFVVADKLAWERMQKLLPAIVKERFMLFTSATYGMSKEKEKALCHPYPSLLEKIERFGYDPKQLHHIVRLRMLVEDTYKNDFHLALVPKNKEYLVELKKGLLNLASAQALIEVELETIQRYRELGKEMPVRGDALYELEGVVREVVKRGVAAEMQIVPEGYSMQGYKAPFASLPSAPKAFVKENYPEVDEKHLVEVLEVKYYQLMNFWEK